MKIKLFELIEESFKEKIKSAILTDEKGNVKEIKPFFIKGVEFFNDIEGIEHIKYTGEDLYAVRFSVENEGKYVLKIELEDATIEKEYEAEDGGKDGFLCVSEQDKRYFKLSNNKPYYPIGVNLAFPRVCPVSNNKEFGVTGEKAFIGLAQYENWFRKCAKNGVNLVRIWAGHVYFSPDTIDAQYFNYEQFTKMDRIFALAKKYNIKIKLTLEQFRWFKYGSDPKAMFNKNLYVQGQRCSSAKEWMAEEKWRKAWLLKVEEYARRYGEDTTLAILELWNEMNCMGEEWGQLYPEIAKWNEEMIPRVKELFPNIIVTNSIGSLDSEETLDFMKMFPWDKCDIKQMHRYLDQGAKYEDSTRHPIESIQTGLARIKEENKPFIVAETGAVNRCHSGEFLFYSTDDRGVIFTDCVYTPVFLTCASCGHIWHWDQRYIESKNLYKYFKPIAELVKGIDFPSESFETQDFSDEDMYAFVLKGKNVSLGFIRNKNDNWQNVLRDFKEIKKVDKKEIKVPEGNLTVCPIWNEDTTKLKLVKGNLEITDFNYGVLFRIDNMEKRK